MIGNTEERSPFKTLSLVLFYSFTESQKEAN